MQHCRFESCAKFRLFFGGGAMTSESNGTEKEVSRWEEEAVCPTDQALDEVNARLTGLSERVNLCTAVLSDLKDLGDIIAKRALRDVTLPQQK